MKVFDPGICGWWRRGFSLMEAVMAVGVMAAVLPWMMLALGEGLETGADVRVEELAMRVVPLCLDVWSRGDREPEWYAIGVDGRILGVVDPESAALGVPEWERQRVLVLCRVAGIGVVERPGAGCLRRVLVRVDYPAGAAARCRRHLDFHTLRS